MSIRHSPRMGEKVHVLNHGYVQLIDFLGDDLRVSNAARNMVADWRGKDDVKLIHHLYWNRHTSPFEHVIFTLEVQAPISVFRQWHRHRTWSYSEISARYQVLPDLFYIPEPENIGVQSKKNHQARDETQELSSEDRQKIIDRFTRNCRTCYDDYMYQLSLGCPRELARGCLNVHTYSRMWATVDLHNLLHFLTLRDDPHAQKEIRVYAQAIGQIVDEIVPHTMDEWRKYKAMWTKFLETHHA